MKSLVHIDVDAMEEEFSKKKDNITEIMLMKSVVSRRKNMIRAESNDFMQKRERVLKSLERNMFNQEMKLMAIILMQNYGDYSYSGRYYYRDYYSSKLIKDNRRNLCLITSQGLHLTLSSLNE